jgi:hypothetical protein
MACEAGLVYIVEDSFPDKRTLELFYNELEQFAPTLPDGRKWRSSRRIKDDVADSCSDAFNTLNKQQVIPTIVMPTLARPNDFLF